MGQATFERHQHLVSEGEKTNVSQLPHLTDNERALFSLLKRNNWRIEQERLAGEWVAERLSEQGEFCVNLTNNLVSP